MSLQCTYCNYELKTGRTSLGGTVACEKCGSKIESGYNSRQKGSVGIHPLLAKRYGDIEAESFLRAAQSRVTPVANSQTPSDDAEWPSIPGYELIERIGKGAMGSVFRALHLASRREAALKILASELVSRDDLVARFEREAAALRSFRHRNVVAIFDSGSIHKTHYYSMEYVLGTTLRKVVKVGPMDPKVAIKFARQMLQALKAAHDRGIIHRDLKPENIIIEAEQGATLSGNERLVLVDFGLAGILNEAADPHPNLTHSRVTMGTVNYMAPEQHIDAKRVDHRSDLYAAGVIIYECLTGDLPLGRFAMPREKGVAVPPSVDTCLIKALARLPQERFQSAEEFDTALGIIETELACSVWEPLSPVKETPRPKIKFFDKWNLGIAREKLASQHTVFPTKWMKSPPWLKRPAFVAAGVTFGIFMMAAVVIANRAPREVAISATGATPVFAKGNFNAPSPVVRKDANASSIELGKAGGAGQLVKWESESPVWGYENERIGYFAKQGDRGHFRRDFSFAVSPEKLTIGGPLTYSAHLSFERLVLPVDITLAQHMARESLGSSPEIPAGGVFLVNKRGRRAIGMIVFADGSCGMTEAHRNGSALEEDAHRRVNCKAPFDGKSLEVKMVCDLKTKSCTGYVGGQKVATEGVEGLGDETWHVALGCRNLNCLFDGAGKKS
jgi:serine/threonine protein kinase